MFGWKLIREKDLTQLRAERDGLAFAMRSARHVAVFVGGPLTGQIHELRSPDQVRVCDTVRPFDSRDISPRGYVPTKRVLYHAGEMATVYRPEVE